MAFKGDLANITLFDVFQTLNTNRQTGVLVLRRDGVMKKIQFSPEGVRIFFTRSARPLRLGEIFVRRGRVTRQDVEILLMQQKQEYRPIGQMLVESGKVSEEELHQTLRYHAEDEVYEVFGWDRGSFAFFDRDAEEGHNSNTPLSEVVLDAGGICLEAARRLDEIERLREIVPNDWEFYVRCDNATIDLGAISPEVAALFDALEEPGSVDGLRDIVSSTLFQVLRSLTALCELNVVRPLGTEELVEHARESRAAGRYERAARLLERAHERDPSDAAVLEECVGVLERIEEPEGLAERLAQLGAIRAAAGEHERALEHLEQSLHHDPGYVAAMLTQRDCFAALDDSERAAEATMRIARTYADQQDLKRAVDTCRDGLVVSPGSVPLRFHYAQLLARTDGATVAQSELRDIIDSARAPKAGGRTRRSRELLIACHTLLLRIDPSDEEAQTGLRELENQSSENRRRRRITVRVGIGAAALMLVLAVGVSLMPPSPDDMMEEAMAMRTAGNASGMQELLTRITVEHPDSKAATAAHGILNSVDDGAKQKAAEARALREASTREEYADLLKRLQSQLAEGALGEAVSELAYFLRRLSEKPAAFLRKELGPTIQIEVEQFIERAEREFGDDRGFVSTCERQMMQGDGTLLRNLGETEERLALVRGRNWPELSKQLTGKLKEALATGLVKGSKKQIEKYCKSMATAGSAMSGLDTLYFRVRSQHLKEQIRSAVKDARTEGRTLLGKCEFEGAIRYYRTAYERADSAAREQPRKHFKDLNNWIADRGLLEDLQKSIDEVQLVVSGLEELDQLIEQGREDTGFRLLRNLVNEHRLVQFERRYKMPYRVTSEPSGAKVIVDGRQVGVTPCAVEFDIAEGIDVRIEAPGFVPTEARLDITNPELDGLLTATLQKIGLWEHSLRGSPETRPVLHDGLVLVPTNEASLRALRVSDGKQMWEAESKLLERIKAAPLAFDGHALFVTTSGRLFRVRLSDGAIVGRLELPGEVHHDGVVVDGTAYFATRSRKLVAVRKGRTVYATDLAFVPVTGLLVHGQNVIVGTTDGELLVHSRKTGKEVRRLAAPDRSSFFGGIAALGDLVVAAAEDGYLHAFNPATGKHAWRYRMPVQLAASPLVDENFLYLPMRNGFVQAVTHAGKPGQRLDFRNSMACSPVFSDGFLYLAAANRLIAYDHKGKRRWWEVTFEDEMPLHLVVGESIIVAVTDGGSVLAYPADKR